MKSIRNVMEMTWKEMEAIPKEKTVLFMTLAPIEEHGHHLPLGVDLFEGKHWEKTAIESLSRSFPDFIFLNMPEIPIAHGCIGRYPGNFHFRQRTVRSVVRESLENFSQWGIENIIILASHCHPRFHIAVAEACRKVNRKYGLRAFSPLGAFFSADESGLDLELTEGIREQIGIFPTDIHAGWVETSMMLDINENLVGDFKSQPDTLVQFKEMMFPARVEKKIAGYGHIGSPKLADKKLGKEVNEHMTAYLTRAVSAFLQRRGYEPFQEHQLIKLPFLRTDFLRTLAWGSMAILALIGAFLFL